MKGLLPELLALSSEMYVFQDEVQDMQSLGKVGLVMTQTAACPQPIFFVQNTFWLSKPLLSTMGSSFIVNQKRMQAIF